MSEHRPDSVEPSLVGTMLGSYRITGELSRGGMGAVYRAEHTVLERKVAVKLLRPDLTANRELVSRFINEAKAASAIRHPGIIEVLDFGHADDGRAYFVMEMLDGHSLAQRIEAHGKLPEREAAKLARSIASALTAAHGKGIVHRDLKPDNIFVVPDLDVGERAKVLDFGIAKLGDRQPDATKYTQTGALMGTPLYMAPEQARAAGHIDQRADLYSLGCILYEMLVGQPPFVAVGAGEIIALQLFGTVEPPSTRVAGISPAIERIVMRLLEKEPVDRFQTAAELGDALAAALGEPVAATPVPQAGARPAAETQRVTAAPTAVSLPARSIGWIAGVAVATVVAIAAGAFLLLRGGDSPPPAASQAAPAPPAASSPATPAPTPTPAPTEPGAPAATPAPSPSPAPTGPVDQPAAASAQPAAPVTDAPKPPVRREKPRARDQKGSAASPRYTKNGSPIEIDLN